MTLITLLTGGTRGDTQPYIALGLGLKKAGYDVRVAAFENYKEFVEEYDLEFFPLKGDVSIVASSDEAQIAMKADNPLKLLFSFKQLQKFVFDLQKDFLDATEGSDAILYHPGGSIAYFIAQKEGIPCIFAPPFPMAVTKEYPSLAFYQLPRLGKLYNRFTHKMFERIMWFATKKPIKQFWKKMYGKKPPKFKSPYSRQNTTINPTIMSSSKFVFSKPSDFSENIHITGYWFLDEKQDWIPPADLEQFIKDGDRPIYVGFGSIKDLKQAKQTTEIVIEAVSKTQQRAILATGWKGMGEISEIPENIYILDKAPHSWLFPQMKMVVHHGGAGTTAAGLRAGVPSIIIPFSNDQFGWGTRIAELKVGSKPIPRKKLTVKKLIEAIEFCMHSEIIENAQEIGKNIREENGVEKAVLVIEKALEEKKRKS